MKRRQLPWSILWAAAFAGLLTVFILFYFKKISPTVLISVVSVCIAAAILAGAMFHLRGNTMSRRQLPWSILWALAAPGILAVFMLFHFEKISLNVLIPVASVCTAAAVLAGALYEWNTDRPPWGKQFRMVSGGLTVFILLMPLLLVTFHLHSLYAMLALVVLYAGTLTCFLIGSNLNKCQDHPYNGWPALAL